MLHILRNKSARRKAIVAALAMLSNAFLVVAQETYGGSHPTNSQGQFQNPSNQGTQSDSKTPGTGRSRDTSQTEQTQQTPMGQTGRKSRKSKKNKHKGQGSNNSDQNSIAPSGTGSGSQDGTSNSGKVTTKHPQGDGSGANSPTSTRP